MKITIEDFDGDREKYWEYIQEHHPDAAEFIKQISAVFGRCEPPIIKTSHELNS